jgi:hypothetical protein
MKSYSWNIQVVEDNEAGEIMEGTSGTESVLIGLNGRTSFKPPPEANLSICQFVNLSIYSASISAT